jgi:hypothetical protein
VDDAGVLARRSVKVDILKECDIEKPSSAVVRGEIAWRRTPAIKSLMKIVGLHMRKQIAFAPKIIRELISKDRADSAR